MTRFLFAVHPTDYSLYAGFIHLGAGLACGFTGLAAGYAIGYVGDSVCSLIIVSDGCRRGLIIELEVCSSIRLRVQSVRIYGAHPHLRRSIGFVWVRSILLLLPAVSHRFLYSLIVALIMNSRAAEAPSCVGL